MQRDTQSKSTESEHESPLQSIRMDKTAFSVVSLSEADSADKAFWAAQSPTARLQALEVMRQVAYGYDPATTRLERVLEVAERVPR
jgi:hypothetical protein